MREAVCGSGERLKKAAFRANRKPQTAMSFIQLILPIGAADPAPYEDALLAAGASSLTLEDEGDDPVLEPLPGTTPLWPRVRLKALFDGAADPEELLQILNAELSGA